MAHKIVVRVSPDGKTEVRVDGLKGASCKDVTKALERALGMTAGDKTTAEYNQVAQEVHLHQGGGA